MREWMRTWPLVLALVAGGLSSSLTAQETPPPAPGSAAAETGPGASRTDPADGAVYRYIPAGSFEMGSPPEEAGRNPDESRHQVTITRPYWMAETEVTQGQWQAVMGSNPSRHSNCGPSCPVEQVNFFEAIDYANRLSRKAGLEECYQVSGASATFKGLGCGGFRLPTEAEWEYAARAGGTQPWAGSDDSDAVAWIGANSGGTTQPVGAKQANAWGLRDMSGNVKEWCWDWYADYPSGSATDPTGPTGGTLRVARGGSFGGKAAAARSAVRGWQDPDDRLAAAGLRLVRTAD